MLVGCNYSGRIPDKLIAEATIQYFKAEIADLTKVDTVFFSIDTLTYESLILAQIKQLDRRKSTLVKPAGFKDDDGNEMFFVENEDNPLLQKIQEQQDSLYHALKQAPPEEEEFYQVKPFLVYKKANGETFIAATELFFDKKLNVYTKKSILQEDAGITTIPFSYNQLKIISMSTTRKIFDF